MRLPAVIRPLLTDINPIATSFSVAAVRCLRALTCIASIFACVSASELQAQPACTEGTAESYENVGCKIGSTFFYFTQAAVGFTIGNDVIDRDATQLKINPFDFTVGGAGYVGFRLSLLGETRNLVGAAFVERFGGISAFAQAASGFAFGSIGMGPLVGTLSAPGGFEATIRSQFYSTSPNPGLPAIDRVAHRVSALPSVEVCNVNAYDNPPNECGSAFAEANLPVGLTEFGTQLSVGEWVSQDPGEPNIADVDHVDFYWRIVQTSVVPEPSTYAMMVAGLLAVGVAARRRRQSMK